jgi:hypothetical protein
MMLGWVLGCAFIYAALFGTGSALYGRTAQAVVWLAVSLISGVGLVRILPRLWSGAAVKDDAVEYIPANAPR